MVAPKKIDPFQNPFGYALRRHRLRHGLTQGDLGKETGYTEGGIGKIEKGEVAPNLKFARRCDEIFGTHGDMEHYAELTLATTGLPSWMREWVEFEQTAHTLRSWQPIVVPGLLQTEAYARELIRTYPWLDDEKVEERTAARLDRQKILRRDDLPAPMLWVVLHESVLHTEVGNAEVMHEQLRALLDVSRRPRITIQAVPLAAGMHAGHLGAFTIASINGSPDVVYLESARAARVTDQPDDVQEMTNIWQAIFMKALPDDASLSLIEKVATQWT